MKWLRRIAAVSLLLLCLICVIGSVRTFRHELPDSSVGSALTAAFAAAAFGIGAFFLIRPDLLALRGPTFARLRDRAFVNPLGQAALLFAAAVILMLASPKSALVFAVVAVCVFSVWSRLDDGLPTPLVGLRPAIRARLDPSLRRVERDGRSAQPPRLRGRGDGVPASDAGFSGSARRVRPRPLDAKAQALRAP
jgi:hypothetical protein